jgi:hypothetical protein
MESPLIALKKRPGKKSILRQKERLRKDMPAPDFEGALPFPLAYGSKKIIII